MNNLYSVGEVVILDSKSSPQNNGEYTIVKIELRATINWLGVGPKPEGKTLFYDLGLPRLYVGSALRKRQQPGVLSFQELMETFKTEICVNN